MILQLSRSATYSGTTTHVRKPPHHCSKDKQRTEYHTQFHGTKPQLERHGSHMLLIGFRSMVPNITHACVMYPKTTTKGTFKETVYVALPLKQEFQFSTAYYSLNIINSILHFLWITKEHAEMSRSLIIYSYLIPTISQRECWSCSCLLP
jgi:hypothetical protein